MGWFSAILAGFSSFWLFQFVLKVSGATRELVEAISTGLASLLLFYTGFWFLSQNERNSWITSMENKQRMLLTRGQVSMIFFI